MQIGDSIHVQCLNDRCPRPADVNVPVPEVARGVLSYPTDMRCAGCGLPVVKVVKDA